MDEYDRLKSEDFTECSLEGLTVDGKLPAIIERYMIWTDFAKTKFVSKEYENWTASEAMEFYNKMPEFGEGMKFCRAYDEKGLADYMLKIEGLNCIDLKNNVCDFGSTFVELLDFCKNNPINSAMFTDYNNESEYLPQEIKEMLYEYILSVPANPYIPQFLEYIINEECVPVILGDRTAEDTAEILQNRVSLYMSEKS